jgi:hypothetical protein
MKETKIGSTTIREHPGIYERRFLGDRDLFIVLDGEEVHLPPLLEEIPADVLRRAAESARAKAIAT